MTEKQSGELEDALASMKTAKDFITSKKLPSMYQNIAARYAHHADALDWTNLEKRGSLWDDHGRS